MIIAISGTIDSGKTTLSNIIKGKYPDFRNTSFSAVPKLMLSILYATRNDYFYDKKYRNEILDDGLTVREAMQKVAGGMRDGIDEDIWIKALGRRLDDDKNYIIDDLRYKNEYEYLNSLKKDQKVILIRLINKIPNYEISEEVANHQSEVDLNEYGSDKWDAYFENEGVKGTLETFFKNKIEPLINE